MIFFQEIKELFWGIVASIMRIFIPVKPNVWIFGADFGRTYREGSKYLLEYMLKTHAEYDCVFITRNKSVYKELINKQIPCEMNFSVKGLKYTCKADKIFFTQYTNDILYVTKRKGRDFYYILHGQPFKYAANTLHSRNLNFLKANKSLLLYIKKYLHVRLVTGFSLSDVKFISATSEFEALFLRQEHDEKVEIKILGMPRNDILFHPDEIAKMKWIENVENKYIISYMPTHRKYGHGDVSPVPFQTREDVQEWMRKNNVVLLVKQHPNMIKRRQTIYESDVIRDISNMQLDPQVVIAKSNVLITDYSSVWIDYLLLRRPLIFYFYDNFEEEDAGCYYDLRKEFPNNYCETEDDLYEMIKKVFTRRNALVPSEEEIHKYHKYVDDKSCERYYDAIVH